MEVQKTALIEMHPVCGSLTRIASPLLPIITSNYVPEPSSGKVEVISIVGEIPDLTEKE
jgi:hypothetical protein